MSRVPTEHGLLFYNEVFNSKYLALYFKYLFLYVDMFKLKFYIKF